MAGPKRRFTVYQRLDQIDETLDILEEIVDETNAGVHDLKNQIDSEVAERGLYFRRLGAFSSFAMDVYNRLVVIEKNQKIIPRKIGCWVMIGGLALFATAALAAYSVYQNHQLQERLDVIETQYGED